MTLKFPVILESTAQQEPSDGPTETAFESVKGRHAHQLELSKSEMGHLVR